METNDEFHAVGRVLGFTDAQVRKIWPILGNSLTGIGYRVSELIDATRAPWPSSPGPWRSSASATSAGPMMGYRGFAQQGFEIVAAFDTDPAKIGKSVEGIEIFDLERVQQIAGSPHPPRRHPVPSVAAQKVADALVAAGIEGILNFCSGNTQPSQASSNHRRRSGHRAGQLAFR